MIKRSLVWLSPTTVSVTVLAGCSVAEQCNFILVKGRWMLWRQEGSRESDVALVMRHRLCVLCGHQPMASETWRWAPYLWYTCSRNNLDHGVVNLSLSYCVTPSSLQLAFVELVTEKRPLFVTAAFPAYFFCVPTQIRGYIFSFFLCVVEHFSSAHEWTVCVFVPVIKCLLPICDLLSTFVICVLLSIYWLTRLFRPP